MALHTRVTLVDDLDASTKGVDTYRFGLDGVEYEIDLSQPNLQALEELFAPYIAAGRRQPRQVPKGGTTAAKKAAPGAVRQWWAEHQQSSHLLAWRKHGPIPKAVYAAYRTAH